MSESERLRHFEVEVEVRGIVWVHVNAIDADEAAEDARTMAAWSNAQCREFTPTVTREYRGSELIVGTVTP